MVSVDFIKETECMVRRIIKEKLKDYDNKHHQLVNWPPNTIKILIETSPDRIPNSVSDTEKMTQLVRGLSESYRCLEFHPSLLVDEVRQEVKSIYENFLREWPLAVQNIISYSTEISSEQEERNTFFSSLIQEGCYNVAVLELMFHDEAIKISELQNVDNKKVTIQQYEENYIRREKNHTRREMSKEDEVYQEKLKEIKRYNRQMQEHAKIKNKILRNFFQKNDVAIHKSEEIIPKINSILDKGILNVQNVALLKSVLNEAVYNLSELQLDTLIVNLQEEATIQKNIIVVDISTYKNKEEIVNSPLLSNLEGTIHYMDLKNLKDGLGHVRKLINSEFQNAQYVNLTFYSDSRRKQNDEIICELNKESIYLNLTTDRHLEVDYILLDGHISREKIEQILKEYNSLRQSTGSPFIYSLNKLLENQKNTFSVFELDACCPNMFVDLEPSDALIKVVSSLNELFPHSYRRLSNYLAELKLNKEQNLTKMSNAERKRLFFEKKGKQEEESGDEETKENHYRKSFNTLKVEDEETNEHKHKEQERPSEMSILSNTSMPRPSEMMEINDQNFDHFMKIYTVLRNQESGKMFRSNYSALDNQDATIFSINAKIHNPDINTRSKKAAACLKEYNADLSNPKLENIVGAFETIYKGLRIADAGFKTNFLEKLEGLGLQEKYITIREHAKKQKDSGKEWGRSLVAWNIVEAIMNNSNNDADTIKTNVINILQGKIVNKDKSLLGMGSLFYRNSTKKQTEINTLINNDNNLEAMFQVSHNKFMVNRKNL